MLIAYDIIAYSKPVGRIQNQKHYKLICGEKTMVETQPGEPVLLWHINITVLRLQREWILSGEILWK